MLVNSQEAMICVRRVKKEYASIMASPVPNITVSLDGEISSDTTNHLDWFCTISGLEDERYKGGEYIFNIRLSARYPFEPPDFYFITPNGRFALNCKLCFTNSSYHKECWSPSWTMRTILLGFLSFFLEFSSQGVGHITTTLEEKKALAESSKEFNAKFNKKRAEAVLEKTNAQLVKVEKKKAAEEKKKTTNVVEGNSNDAKSSNSKKPTKESTNCSIS